MTFRTKRQLRDEIARLKTSIEDRSEESHELTANAIRVLNLTPYIEQFEQFGETQFSYDVRGFIADIEAAAKYLDEAEATTEQVAAIQRLRHLDIALQAEKEPVQ